MKSGYFITQSFLHYVHVYSDQNRSIQDGILHIWSHVYKDLWDASIEEGIFLCEREPFNDED